MRAISQTLPAHPPASNTQTHWQDRLQYTVPLASAQCNNSVTISFHYVVVDRFYNRRCPLLFFVCRVSQFIYLNRMNRNTPRRLPTHCHVAYAYASSAASRFNSQHLQTHHDTESPITMRRHASQTVAITRCGRSGMMMATYSMTHSTASRWREQVKWTGWTEDNWGDLGGLSINEVSSVDLEC